MNSFEMVKTDWDAVNRLGDLLDDSEGFEDLEILYGTAHYNDTHDRIECVAYDGDDRYIITAVGDDLYLEKRD